MLRHFNLQDLTKEALGLTSLIGFNHTYVELREMWKTNYVYLK